MGRSRLPRVCTRESLCAPPGLTADTPLACFSSSTLDSLRIVPASPPASPLERKDGTALTQGLEEVRDGPSHPSLSSLLKTAFAPPKPFRTNLDTASCHHTCLANGRDEKTPSAQLLSSQGSHRTRWSPHPTAFPVLCPSAKNHCRVQAYPPPPQHVHVHVPVPPTHTVVQRPRAELVCT